MVYHTIMMSLVGPDRIFLDDFCQNNNNAELAGSFATPAKSHMKK
ncbi:hypothetical protein A6R68_06885, partial [Neotoma lepida]